MNNQLNNLFKLAKQNTKKLRINFQLLIRKNRNSFKFQKFRFFINKNWLFSINMGQIALDSFLSKNIYMNVYDVEKEDISLLKGGTGIVISNEDSLKGYLKNYFNPRIIFDNNFINSRKFKYGALNLGTIGITCYGIFCVVFKRRELEKKDMLVFVKDDSLNYIKDNLLDFEKFSQEIANNQSVHFLSVLKHYKEINRYAPKNWSSMICNNNCYIEGITENDLKINQIKCVRISYAFYKSNCNILLSLASGKQVNEIDKYKIYIFKRIKDSLKKHDIAIEIIKK